MATAAQVLSKLCALGSPENVVGMARFEWSGRKSEYVKRAGFASMATLAVHHKMAGDEVFLRLLPVIEREAVDERNFL